jgi:hypothetical protein
MPVCEGLIQLELFEMFEYHAGVEPCAKHSPLVLESVHLDMYHVHDRVLLADDTRIDGQICMHVIVKDLDQVVDHMDGFGDTR